MISLNPHPLDSEGSRVGTGKREGGLVRRWESEKQREKIDAIQREKVFETHNTTREILDTMGVLIYQQRR